MAKPVTITAQKAVNSNGIIIKGEKRIIMKGEYYVNSKELLW